MLDFKNDIKKGKVGENIFLRNFVIPHKLSYKDVSLDKRFQKIDVDFIVDEKLYEIKTNYKDDFKLFIEEYTNVNEDLGKISYGWLHKCEADIMVFVSKMTETMVFLDFKAFKEKYKQIIEALNIPLYRNRISFKGNNKWQSAFRIIPLNLLPKSLYFII